MFTLFQDHVLETCSCDFQLIMYLPLRKDSTTIVKLNTSLSLNKPT